MNEPRFIEVGRQLINVNLVAHTNRFGPHLGIAIVGTPGSEPWDLILEGADADEFEEFIQKRFRIKTIGE